MTPEEQTQTAPTTEPVTTAPATTEPAKTFATQATAEGATEAVTEKTVEQPAEQKPAVEAPVIDMKALKLPEGTTLDEATFKTFSTVLTDDKLSPQERAQSLIELHTSALQKATEAPSRVWNEVVEKWTKEVSTDKDLGSGDPKSPLKPAVSSAIAKAIDNLGGAELRAALDLTGAGNSPAILRALFKAASKFAETSTPTQGGNPPPSSPRGLGAAALYPELPQG